MIENKFFIFLLFFSILLCVQTSLYATSLTSSQSIGCDNLLITNQLQKSEIDSAFTAMSYFPDQDATKTHRSNHYPIPPESPHNDNILHILKDTTRFDHKKHSIPCKQIIEYYCIHYHTLNHPPGYYSKPYLSIPLKSDVLRI